MIFFQGIRQRIQNGYLESSFFYQEEFMDYTLSDEQKQIVEAARKFAAQ